MNLSKHIISAIIPILLSKTNNLINAEDSWNKWDCDDLTFNECQLDVIEGEFDVRGLKVHYWKYSRPNFASDDTEDLPLWPIIFIHGGPSLPHNYALPLKNQACRGRDVVFYDQAGCGKSSIENVPDDQITKKYSWLLDVNYYAMEELPALIDHLGYEKYHLIGHSWGSIIAQVFATFESGSGNNSDNVQSLTLSGPKSDLKLFVEAQWDAKDGSISKLPLYLQERIRQLQSTGNFDSDEYIAIVDMYCTLFLIRTQPVPSCVSDSFAGVNINIYYGLYGKDDFSIGGKMEDFNITSRLHQIEVPVLLTSGRYDDVRPRVVDTIQKEIQQAERVVFSKSAHLSMIDEPDRMNEVVQDFLDRVEHSVVNGKKFEPNSSLKNNVIDSEIRKQTFSLTILAGSCVGTFVIGAYVGYLIYRWNQKCAFSIPCTNSETLKKDY